jgi:O-antigen/teichoic acid export membrane protein
MLKKLASQTVIYGISSNLGRFLNYALVYLHTAVFLPAEYGIISDFYAKAAFFNVLYTYGMETAYFRFVSKPENDKQEIYSLVLSSLLTTSLFFSLLLTFFATFFAKLMQYPPSFGQYVVWFAWLFAADAIVAIPFARLRQENKAKLFAILRIISIVANVSLNYFLLWVLPNYFPQFYSEQIGIGYVFLANLLANLLVLPFLWQYFVDFKFTLHLEKLKPIFLYAYPILFTGFAGMINEVLSRDFIKYWLPEGFYAGRSNLDAVGIFSACYKFSVFITLAVQGFKYAAEPFFFSKAADKNSPELFAKVTKYFVILCVCMYAGVSLNLDLLQHLFLATPIYAEGLIIVPFLLLANLFLGVYYNLSVWFKVTDKTYYGTLLGFFGAAITILGNLLLIPILGYLGSAITTLLCYFCMTAASYYIGQKHYPVPYKIGNAFTYIGLATGFILVGWLFKFDSFWVNQVWHIFLTGLVLAFIFLQEYKEIKS